VYSSTCVSLFYQNVYPEPEMSIYNEHVPWSLACFAQYKAKVCVAYYLDRSKSRYLFHRRRCLDAHLELMASTSILVWEQIQSQATHYSALMHL
jgi:hypothetical protein